MFVDGVRGCCAGECKSFGGRGMGQEILIKKFMDVVIVSVNGWACRRCSLYGGLKVTLLLLLLSKQQRIYIPTEFSMVGSCR